MGKLVMVSLVVMLAALPAPARADQAEWRIGAGGGGTVVNARTGGADGTGIGYEAHGRLGHGVSNTLELGLIGGYTHAPDLAFASASVGGQTGTLFADMSTVTISVEFRWTPGLGLARAFERTSPYVAARAGAALLVRTSQQLFTETGLLILAPADDLRLIPFAAAAIGVEHRFGDHLFLPGEFTASLVGDVRLMGLTAEAGWAWY